MLQKLKIQLVLINVVLLTVVLLAIFISVYFLLEKQLTGQENDLLQKAALNDDNAVPSLSIFYVKRDHTGNIIGSVSPNAVITQDNRELTDFLIEVTDALDKRRGDVELVDIPLSFLIEDKSYGKIYVFIDRSSRDEALSSYVYIAVFVLIASVICVFFISMFLASKAIKPIKDSIERQDKFIADASHELRTPIAVIRSNIEMVMDSPELTVEENMKWLEYIYKEAKRMTKMTEDLLLLSQADAKREVLKEPVNLSVLTEDTYESFKMLFAEHNLSDGGADISGDIYVYGNEFRIKQLITILIDNAIKYTKEGGVFIRLERDDESAYIKIRDTGPGIPNDVKDKIFERFFRIDKARSKATGGLGLGLSIAKVIADEHGGDISVESELNKGSEFCVKLPIYQNISSVNVKILKTVS